MKLLLLLPLLVLPAGALAQETDVLLRIAERADEQTLYQLEGAQASPEIEALYERGRASVELLRAEADAELARAHFLEAMGSFVQACRLLDGDGAPDRDARSELQRLSFYVERLRGVSEDGQMGVDFDQIDAFMDLARDQAWGSAPGDPLRTLDSLGPLVEAVSAEIRERSASADEARVRAFIEEQLALFEPEAGGVPGAVDLISEIRAALSEGRTDDAKASLRELAELMGGPA